MMNESIRFYAPNQPSGNVRGKLRDQLNRLCAEGWELFIDTCSLLTPRGLRLLETAEEVLPLYGTQLNIFSSVLAEIERVGKRNSDKRREARLILQKLKMLEQKGLVCVINAGSRSFSDVNFISEFILRSCERSGRPLLLVTQDKALAERIDGLGTYLGEVVRNKRRCEAMRLALSGELEPFHSQYQRSGSTLIFGPLIKFR